MPSRQQPALAHEEQPVAALGLVHHVAGDDEAAAVGGELVEEPPQVAPQHRVEADGGLVEHQHLGAGQQGDGEGDPAALAAREGVDDPVGLAGEVDLREAAAYVVGAGAEHPGEEAQVLGHRQVAVHAGRLGDVADAPAQRCRPGRVAQDRDLSPGDLLDTDERAHQRGLAAARRAEQPDDLAGGRLEAEVVDRDGAAADHDEVADLDR